VNASYVDPEKVLPGFAKVLPSNAKGVARIEERIISVEPCAKHLTFFDCAYVRYDDRCGLACELSRVPLVVVIQKGDPFAVGSENACISRSARPPILLVQILNPRTVGIEYIAGTIGRTIVDNNDLNWRKGLVQCAGNRLIHPVRVVVRGYDSGDRKR